MLKHSKKTVLLLIALITIYFSLSAVVQAEVEDIIPPKGDISINGDAFSTDSPSVVLSISASDNVTLPENMLVQYSNDGITITIHTAYINITRAGFIIKMTYYGNNLV